MVWTVFQQIEVLIRVMVCGKKLFWCVRLLVYSDLERLQEVNSETRWCLVTQQ